MTTHPTTTGKNMSTPLTHHTTGKNLGIVLPDADLEEAVAQCVLGALSYNGQRCTAIKARCDCFTHTPFTPSLH